MAGKKNVFHIISQRICADFYMLSNPMDLEIYIYNILYRYYTLNRSIIHSFINPFTSLGKERENRGLRVHTNKPLNMTIYFLQAAYSHEAERQDV